MPNCIILTSFTFGMSSHLGKVNSYIGQQVTCLLFRSASFFWPTGKIQDKNCQTQAGVKESLSVKEQLLVYYVATKQHRPVYNPIYHYFAHVTVPTNWLNAVTVFSFLQVRKPSHDPGL